MYSCEGAHIFHTCEGPRLTLSPFHVCSPCFSLILRHVLSLTLELHYSSRVAVHQAVRALVSTFPATALLVQSLSGMWSAEGGWNTQACP